LETGVSTMGDDLKQAIDCLLDDDKYSEDESEEASDYEDPHVDSPTSKDVDDGLNLN